MNTLALVRKTSHSLQHYRDQTFKFVSVDSSGYFSASANSVTKSEMRFWYQLYV
jgi:hypothetical protein